MNNSINIVQKLKKYIKNTVPDKWPNPEARTADVLVMFTVKAMWQKGGVMGLLNHVNDMIQYTNWQFKQKGVHGSVRLVGLVQADFPEFGDHDKKMALNALRRGHVRSGDGNSRTLREHVGADIIALVHHNKRGGGGLAQVMGDWAVMPSNTRAIFRHELAHTFGWNHGDRGNYSMIEANFRRAASRRPKRVQDGMVYLQYRGKASATKDNSWGGAPDLK